MNDVPGKLLQERAEPSPDARWPQWIADALAYKPANPAPKLQPSAKAVASESNDRRNIRILSRVVDT